MEFDIKDVENYLLMDRMPNIGVPLSCSKAIAGKVAKKRMNYTEKSWLVKQPAVAVIIKFHNLVVRSALSRDPVKGIYLILETAVFDLDNLRVIGLRLMTDMIGIKTLVSSCLGRRTLFTGVVRMKLYSVYRRYSLSL